MLWRGELGAREGYWAACGPPAPKSKQITPLTRGISWVINLMTLLLFLSVFSLLHRLLYRISPRCRWLLEWATGNCWCSTVFDLRKWTFHMAQPDTCIEEGPSASHLCRPEDRTTCFGCLPPAPLSLLQINYNLSGAITSLCIQYGKTKSASRIPSRLMSKKAVCMDKVL